MACLSASSSTYQHICKVLSPETPESGDFWREKGEIYKEENQDMELTEYESLKFGKVDCKGFVSVSPSGAPQTNHRGGRPQSTCYHDTVSVWQLSRGGNGATV